MAYPATINDALRMFRDDLKSRPTDGSLKVPHPDTITLLGEINALCAQNMIATNWFPHDRMRREGK